jgi:phosphoglycolate phosphatase
MTVKLSLFDCDGTLVDSAANICRAMGDTFARHSLAAPEHHEVRRVVGLSLLEVMRRLHPRGEDAHHVALVADYKACFSAMRETPDFSAEPLYDGIAEVIDTLGASGWALGVATGKSDRGLAMVLAHHGLAARFVTLQTADRHPSKPHPAMALAAIAEAGATPETTIMIGDTSFDMAMGRAAGAAALGVSWGYHEPDELIAAGAQAVAEHAAELPAALDALLIGSAA